MEISGSVIEVDGRRLIQGTFRDVSHRKELEVQLWTERERYRRIFTHPNDAIFVIDPTSDEILDCNARACEMLGYDEGELVGMPISAVHPDEMDRFRSFADHVFETGDGWTDELRCLTNSGERLPSILAGSTIEWENDSAMLACVQDSTEQRHREQALETLQHTAQELLSARSRETSAELAVDAISDVLDTSYGAVWFYDDNEEFRPIATTAAAAREGLPAVKNVESVLTESVTQAGTGVVETELSDEATSALGAC